MAVAGALLMILVLMGCGDDERVGSADGAALDARAADARFDSTPIDAALDGPIGNGDTRVDISRLGDPSFDLVGWSIVTAPLGSTADPSPGVATLEAIWSGHTYDAGLGVLGPGAVHAPPYDGEIAAGLITLGVDPGDHFVVSDWTAPAGLFFVVTLVPSTGAPTGRSPDFETGPIIPSALFPLEVEAELYHKGGVGISDPWFEVDTYPTIDVVAPSSGADGYSHIPFAWGESTESIPGTPGFYHLEIVITDNAGNGWSADLPFRVED